MVLFLNFLPLILLLLALLAIYLVPNSWDNTKKVKAFFTIFIVYVLVMVVYNAALPSYMPKGVVERTAVPEQELVDKPIQDLQPKPMSGEERDARRKEAYKEKLPFLENK